MLVPIRKADDLQPRHLELAMKYEVNALHASLFLPLELLVYHILHEFLLLPLVTTKELFTRLSAIE